MIVVYLYKRPDANKEVHHVNDLVQFLKGQFGRHFPAGGRITDCATGQSVTPKTYEDALALRSMPGPFVVEVFPLAALPPIVVALIVTTASIILQSIFAPTPPNATARNVQQESPNNGLSERTNSVRVNGRVPDVYGQVRSTPDLLAPPYKVFENHVEKEVAYMCIGRGAYEVQDIRDDTTVISEIAGSSVEVYAPFTSPNSGAAPQLRIGNAINLPVITAKRVNSVNGQVLQPQDVGSVIRRGMIFRSPNEIVSQDPNVDFADLFIPGDTIQVQGAVQTQGTFSYSPPSGAVFRAQNSLTPTWGELDFAGNHGAEWSPGQIVTISNGYVTWTDQTGGEASEPYTANSNVTGVYAVLSSTYFSVGNFTRVRLDISQSFSAWAAFRSAFSEVVGTPTLTRPSDYVQFDLSGSYVVTTVTSGLLTLNNPSAVNSGWTVMQDSYGGQSSVLNPTITTTGERWVGWFTVESVKPITRIISNVVALNGLFKDNGRQQYRQNVTYRIEAQRIDGSGNPVGSVEAFERTIVGSAVSRSTRADTLDVVLGGAASARWRFRARRLTNSDTGFEGQVIDEIKWRDLYACNSVDQAHFGDVTTVQSVTFATDGALAIKERKLNMLVTRKLPRRVSGSTFTSELYATTNVADILSAICLDPLIGNRPASEVDFDNFYQTRDDIVSYFGLDIAQFNYTIDSDNLSFEETVSMIAEAVFCRAYRRGSVIRLFFERQTDDSAILFNHRNKLPGSEQRTEGSAAENDGIEYEWINPANDASETIYLPSDRSAVNPRRVESVGVRIYAQASIHAHREWNKLQFQDVATEFDALPEANLLTVSERILCADNTRAGSQDGEIVGIDATNPRLVTLSQPFDWSTGGPFWIFLQNRDGMVESMPVQSGGSPRLALLSTAPRTEIILRGEGYNPTGYIIGQGAAPRQAQPFLITEKGAPNDDGTIPITAINYDDRYYQNDRDFA
ncbi:host specificity factor TipJ family phage tail protein [Achromobacter mucicolens]|uniref:host specificity factor TipJ family phage tail protein n=1 Tax=Achromobacter mucicolens TaxID=1389922 RepID=UPI0028AC264A|nr:host specificity factor TipJ family phage tail protein [Achromobacter mucicolens]